MNSDFQKIVFSIHVLDGAYFSLHFLEGNIITNVNNVDSTLTQIKIYLISDKSLILLLACKQMIVFCNLSLIT